VKLLMFYAHDFWYRTHERVLETVPDVPSEETHCEVAVIFYHAEEADRDREDKVAVKWAKNAKWLARKFGTQRILLHSFNHLASTKAPADVACRLAAVVRDRLERTGFTVSETPFGYQNEWKINVSGDSLAKVFKEI